jgi:hypothetical protein
VERNKVVHERACFANMSCQRLSIVFSFVSRVSFCNDIVESVIIKLSSGEYSLDPDLLKLSIMQVNHLLLFDLHYQTLP